MLFVIKKASSRLIDVGKSGTKECVVCSIACIIANTISVWSDEATVGA